jgi:hypothetical protein
MNRIKSNKKTRHILPMIRAEKAAKAGVQYSFKNESIVNRSSENLKNESIDASLDSLKIKPTKYLNSKISASSMLIKALEINILRLGIVVPLLLQIPAAEARDSYREATGLLLILNMFISQVQSRFTSLGPFNCPFIGTDLEWAYNAVVKPVFDKRESIFCRIFGIESSCYDKSLLDRDRKILKEYFANPEKKNGDYSLWFKEVNPVAWAYYCSNTIQSFVRKCNPNPDYFTGSDTYRAIFPKARPQCPGWPNLTMHPVELEYMKRLSSTITPDDALIRVRKSADDNLYAQQAILSSSNGLDSSCNTSSYNPSVNHDDYPLHMSKSEMALYTGFVSMCGYAVLRNVMNL